MRRSGRSGKARRRAASLSSKVSPQSLHCHEKDSRAFRPGEEKQSRLAKKDVAFRPRDFLRSYPFNAIAGMNTEGNGA
jgi:hypothetical protein